MGTQLDIDDVAAQSPLARKELDELRAKLDELLSRIDALTEELRGIEQALDDPRIHNTHTIEEVLREKLAGLNKFERI